MYLIRLFKDLSDSCFIEINAPIVPHIGESFFLSAIDGWFLVKEVIYNDLDKLYMIDMVVKEITFDD